jgi:hypothetical protein
MARSKPQKPCEWCGVLFTPYSSRGRWHSYECKSAAAAKEQTDRQAMTAQRKRAEVTALIDELVETGVYSASLTEFYSLSSRLRRRGLSFEQVYGLVNAYVTTRIKRNQAHSEDAALVINVMEKLGQITPDYDEYRAKLIDYLCA